MFRADPLMIDSVDEPRTVDLDEWRRVIRDPGFPTEEYQKMLGDVVHSSRIAAFSVMQELAGGGIHRKNVIVSVVLYGIISDGKSEELIAATTAFAQSPQHGLEEMRRVLDNGFKRLTMCMWG